MVWRHQLFEQKLLIVLRLPLAQTARNDGAVQTGIFHAAVPILLAIFDVAVVVAAVVLASLLRNIGNATNIA